MYKNKLVLLSSLLLSASFILADGAHYKEINAAAEHEKHLKQPTVVVIKYYTEWCGACKQMTPHFDQAAGKNVGKAKFYAADVSKASLKHLVKKHKIQGYPTTIFYRNGKEVHRERGAMMSVKEIEGALKRALGGRGTVQVEEAYVLEQPEPVVVKKPKTKHVTKTTSVRRGHRAKRRPVVQTYQEEA